MGTYITKHAFLTALACPTLSWYQRTQPKVPLTPGQELRILEGIEVGALARTQFSNAVLVDEKDPVAAAKRTKSLMADPNVSILFEAAFLAEPFITRVDVLVRSQAGWTVIEVKSARHKDDEIKADHIDDMAYTTMVLRKCGVTPERVELMRLSPEWRGGVGEPFKRADASLTVFNRVAAFLEIANEVSAHILVSGRPTPRLLPSCKNCDFFKNECLGKGVEYPIIEIPRISDKKLNELSALAVRDVRELPVDFELTPAQGRMVESIKSGEMRVNKSKLSKLLSALSWPCYYLDFETAMSALPLWEGIAPSEQVLTQYSLHVCDDLTSEPRHYEYLSPHTRDARRELAEQLLMDIGPSGSVIVYSSFENTRIKELAQLFPDLARSLVSLGERLFDLEVVFKEAVSHPEFRGRTSIKVTLPTLVPEMNYKDLEIGGGDTAVAAFVRMVRGWCSSEESAQLRAALLTYCKQDTLAMVKLHRVVAALGDPGV